MSGIDKVSEKMKKKISFGDYGLAIDPTPNQSAKDPVDARKVYALSKEDTVKLQKIFANRLCSNKEASMAQIMSEAINLLYNQEL